jgi:hypothetical protein
LSVVKKPLVVEDGQLQQIQPGQEVDENSLPYDNTRKLLRQLVRDLLASELLDEGDLSVELIEEATCQDE